LICHAAYTFRKVIGVVAGEHWGERHFFISLKKFFNKLRFSYNFLTVYSSISSVVILLFLCLFVLAAFLANKDIYSAAG